MVKAVKMISYTQEIREQSVIDQKYDQYLQAYVKHTTIRNKQFQNLNLN